MRITTWNVNGIRNPFGYQPWRDRRSFDAMFDILEADIVIMQELKIQRKDLRDDMVLVPGWDCYFSLPKHKKGYSGVGIYTRQSVCAPIRAEEGVLGVLCPPNSTTAYCDLPEDKHIGGYLSNRQLAELGIDATGLDSEGRCVVLEFPAFVLFGIYSPANSSGTRDDFRYGFLCALDMRIRNLIAAGKRVVVTGDLNVSREEIDTANAEETLRKEGMSHAEYISTPNRRIFNQLLEGGEVIGERDEGREVPVMWDICRGFHPDRKGMFTHWEQKINARPGNFGSRIDFILCSLDMKSWFCQSDIQEGLMGSDHCPVFAVMQDQVETPSIVHLQDIMNPTGTFVDGARKQPYSTKTIPAFSGKLMQEFDKRRTIKDMFAKKPSLAPPNDVFPEQAKASNDSQHSNGVGQSTQDDLAGSRSSSQATIFSNIPASQGGSPDRKRSAPSSPVASLKRSKSSSNSIISSQPRKGQKSLKGFFKSNSLAPVQEMVANDKNDTNQVSQSPDNVVIPNAKALDHKSPSSTKPLKENELASVYEDEDEFVDPIVSKESWSKLFTRPTAPRCESHNEPCKVMKTKKTGFNCGREFWMCARPLGPSGSKERGTQWRCPTFIWSSDWNGITEKE